MEYIAGLALTVGILILAVLLAIARAFIEFINRPRTHLTVRLSQEDRDLLKSWRRSGPRVKKEVAREE